MENSVGLGCIMQLGLNSSNFEHYCFVNGRGEDRHAIDVRIIKRWGSLGLVRFQDALDPNLIGIGWSAATYVSYFVASYLQANHRKPSPPPEYLQIAKSLFVPVSLPALVPIRIRKCGEAYGESADIHLCRIRGSAKTRVE